MSAHTHTSDGPANSAVRLSVPAVCNPFGEEERLLFNFGSSVDLQRWNVFSDSQYGGHSAAALKLSTEHKVRRRPAAVELIHKVTKSCWRARY